MDNKKNTSDYSKGKIYKIVCNKTGLVYIGSTCRSLEQRLKEHVYDSKRYLDKKCNKFISSIFAKMFSIQLYFLIRSRAIIGFIPMIRGA
jgi:predicted GIY-YIG superfamily endonuclease